MGFEVEEIPIIELNMMDKRKYFPLTLASGLTIRSILYPFMLIKTRLQIQKGRTVYRGTFDAFIQISRMEGASGLYRGFWLSCLQLFPSMAYISTYEGTRHYLLETHGVTDNRIRSFVGGGLASITGQTLAVPIDIVTQHLMLMGRRNPAKASGQSTFPGTDKRAQQKVSSLQHFHLSESDARSRFGAVRAIVRVIYKQDGLLGFYKGYFISLACFAPNSALWWFFYDSYSVLFASVTPVFIPRLAIQVVAAPLSGISSALLTNPLDVIRARIQVEGTKLGETVKLLWKEEGIWIITKGLSARLVQSVTFSFFIILGYETIKRWSILDEYKDKVRW
ncbi:solute carrier family 25 member 44-like [Physella acuta]|uniref:solute carrier family 25 member 44-like n=1 Tax=Physella acuta TaxID=109671 RepID=UPI0027DCDE31|nr:solute carrier family 25 member 44-like [Physella acuta]XP_059140467.1 solute carrier family 25 member 44-like [Physella acuta]XP_059140468.1 solute carrier family 25 member 44-like [Physella acuta]